MNKLNYQILMAKYEKDKRAKFTVEKWNQWKRYMYNYFDG